MSAIEKEKCICTSPTEIHELGKIYEYYSMLDESFQSYKFCVFKDDYRSFIDDVTFNQKFKHISKSEYRNYKIDGILR